MRLKGIEGVMLSIPFFRKRMKVILLIIAINGQGLYDVGEFENRLPEQKPIELQMFIVIPPQYCTVRVSGSFSSRQSHL